MSGRPKDEGASRVPAGTCLVLAGEFPNALEPGFRPDHLHQFRELARRRGVQVIAPIPWVRLLKKPRLLKLRGGPDPMFRRMDVRHPVFWYLPVVARGRHWRGVVSAASRALCDSGAATPEIVLATFAYPYGKAAQHLAAEFGIPYAVKVRGSDLHALPAGGSRRRLTAEALRGAAAVIAVSENLVRIARELGTDPARIHSLPNAVDLEMFDIVPRAEARARLGLDPEDWIVLFVGNLLPVKGLDVLLDAVGLLRDRFQERGLRLVLAGAGSEKGRLHKQARRLGVGSMVDFPGYLAREEVRLYMNAADVFVLPSRNEGCPLVVLEAQACGTPVVASRVGEIPLLLDENCGILAAPGEPAELAEALWKAGQRDWDRRQVRARVEDMTWEENARELDDILRQAARGYRA